MRLPSLILRRTCGDLRDRTVGRIEEEKQEEEEEPMRCLVLMKSAQSCREEEVDARNPFAPSKPPPCLLALGIAPRACTILSILLLYHLLLLLALRDSVLDPLVGNPA